MTQSMRDELYCDGYEDGLSRAVEVLRSESEARRAEGLFDESNTLRYLADILESELCPTT